MLRSESGFDDEAFGRLDGGPDRRGATIARYIARESPVDCAGGFKSEGLGISLCEAIQSEDPSALIGLPLIRLCSVLRRVGYQIP